MMKLIFNKKGFEKIIAYMLLLLIIYIFIDFIGIFLLTFIFGYLFFTIAKFIKEQKYQISKKFVFLKFLKKTPIWLIIIVEYLIFIGLIVYIFSNIIPTIKSEINSITNEFYTIENIGNNKNLTFIEGEESLIEKSGSVKIITAINNFKETILQNLVLIDPEDNLKMIEYVENFGSNIDLKLFQENIFSILGSIGSSTLKIILALVLSFIFIIDRKRLSKYLFKVKKSNFGFLYIEYDILLKKVVKSFGLILKAQSIIAVANMFITISGFYIIGLFFGGFPYILTMALVVFVLSFIPILGMWLSAIPLVLLAYVNGGIEASLLVLLMILFTTMFEAYYLNPKIVSNFLEIPVSLTFIVLLVSEHFFGFAGLLIGTSLFYFFMGLIKDFDYTIGKNKKKLKKI